MYTSDLHLSKEQPTDLIFSYKGLLWEYDQFYETEPANITVKYNLGMHMYSTIKADYIIWVHKRNARPHSSI